MTRQERKTLMRGIAFISPWIVGFLAFELIPFISSLVYSFCDFDILTPPRFVGLLNYQQMFSDKTFYKSLYNTFYIFIFSVPLSIVVNLLLAMLLNSKIKGLALFRTNFYLPTIMPAVAAAVLWKWLLDPMNGVVNSMLYAIGIQGPGWLSDPNWSKPALVIMSIWMSGRSMVIFLAGLQDVPEELLESASLDGASWLRKKWSIVLPMISPVIFFNLVMGVIDTLQYFTQAYVISSGDGRPLGSTMMYTMYLFNNAFQFGQMGYASAMAWLLFVIILLFTIINFVASKKWVFYSDAT